MLYVVQFFLFAFVGWIVDSSYSSLVRKKIVISGYFRGIPLCPIYGFGGILLVNSFALLSAQPVWLTIVVTTILVVALEYVGGWLAEHLLDEKLWDYSKERWNLGGYISAWHSFLWLLAVSGCYLLFGRQAGDYIAWLDSRLTLNSALEVLLIFALLVAAFFLTSHYKKVRLGRLAQRQLEKLESLDEIFDWEKWRRLAVKRRRQLLREWRASELVERLREWEEKWER